MKKLKSIKRLKQILWELCRQVTEKKYPNVCYTCGRKVEGSGRQLGHCIPSSVGGALLRYHLDNLRWQCYFCNINAGGNGAVFLKNLIEEIGSERVDELFALQRKSVQLDRMFLEEKIVLYTRML